MIKLKHDKIYAEKFYHAADRVGSIRSKAHFRLKWEQRLRKPGGCRAVLGACFREHRISSLKLHFLSDVFCIFTIY